MAKILGWALIGADLYPLVCSFLEIIEERIDKSTVEAALEVDKVPHMKEGVTRVVEKFQKNQEGLKKNK